MPVTWLCPGLAYASNMTTMQATDFDPTADGYEDDHDARCKVWRHLRPDILPEPLGNALARLLGLHDAFNSWVTTPPGAGHNITEHQLNCWAKASRLEALSCKALLEWHHADGTMAAAVKALAKCVSFYEKCLKPSPRDYH